MGRRRGPESYEEAQYNELVLIRQRLGFLLLLLAAPILIGGGLALLAVVRLAGGM